MRNPTRPSRSVLSGTCAAVLLAGLAGASCAEPPPETEDAAGPALPVGYALRLDRSNRDPADLSVVEVPEGVHVLPGPSAILYRLDDRAETGDFVVSAVFTEVAAPRGHREGYGLFVGGAGLDGPDQRYTYFLVRGDGRYLVKRRAGDETWELTEGWVPSDAIELAGDGDATNALSVRVDGDRVHFHCNGEPVAELGADDVSPHGVAGVRINHNLDVLVEGFRIGR